MKYGKIVIATDRLSVFSMLNQQFIKLNIIYIIGS